MHSNKKHPRLADMKTNWLIVRQAHQGTPAQVKAAQAEILALYLPVIKRYLTAALMKDEHAAEDLSQELAVRFLRGQFRHADPSKGSFRGYVMATLGNLISGYRDRQSKQPLSLSQDRADTTAKEPMAEDVRLFNAGLLQEVLQRTWNALAAYDRAKQTQFYAVLQLRRKHKHASMAELAKMLSRDLGKPVTEVSARQRIHRAGERFHALFVIELAGFVEEPTVEALEKELSDLGMLQRCRAVLQQWAKENQGMRVRKLRNDAPR